MENFSLSLDINSRFGGLVITFPRRTFTIYPRILDLSDSIGEYVARYDCTDGVYVRIDTNRMRYAVTEARKRRIGIGQPITWEESKEYSSRECMGEGSSRHDVESHFGYSRGEEGGGGGGPIYTTPRIRFPWENQPGRKDLPY